MGHINKFNDIDIYIEHEEFEKQNFQLERLRDSTGKKIWYKNDHHDYFITNKNIIKTVFSLNDQSNFYQLIKQFSGLRFHPPQIILYTRKDWKHTTQLNRNVVSSLGDYNNLDALMIDAYNIIDGFDLPICRNALLF